MSTKKQLPKKQEVLSWETMREEFLAVIKELNNAYYNVEESKRLLAPVIERDISLKEVFNGATVSLNQAASIILTTGAEHGVNLHTIRDSVLREYPGLFSDTVIIFNGMSTPAKIVNNPEQYNTLFNERLTTALNTAAITNYDSFSIFADSKLIPDGVGHVLNPFLPIFSFKQGTINYSDEDFMTYSSLGLRYVTVRQTIGEIYSAIALDVIPAVGADPKYAEEIKNISLAAKTIIDKINH